MKALSTIPKTKKEHLEKRIALYLDHALIYSKSSNAFSLNAKDMDELVATLAHIAINQLSYPPTP